MMIVRKIDETKNTIDFLEIISNRKITLIKEDFEKAVKELNYWQQDRSASNFHSLLYNLICKADSLNSEKLLKGFPDEMVAYLLWCQSEVFDETFNEFNILEKDE